MNRWLLVACLIIFTSCTSLEERDLVEAHKNIEVGHFKMAQVYLDKVIKRNMHNSKFPMEAAREAAKITFFELKDYKAAINYYHYIIINSPDEKERLESQKQIASIYFNNLQDYNSSISEYSKLIGMKLPAKDLATYRINIARSNYYLNNFFQAESEVDSILNLKPDEKTRQGALLLKGNILVARKDFAKAIEIFKSLIKEFPQFSMDENIGLTLAVCYEENLNFKEAIKVLESYRGTYLPPEFIELRIKRIKQRMKNAPGAKGYRK